MFVYTYIYIHMTVKQCIEALLRCKLHMEFDVVAQLLLLSNLKRSYNICIYVYIYVHTYKRVFVFTYIHIYINKIVSMYKI